MAGQPTAKERMLKNIRKGLIEKKDNPFPELDPTPLYFPTEESLDLVFATELNKVKGEFIYCEDLDSFAINYKSLQSEYGWKDVRVWDDELKEVLSSFNLGYNEEKENLEGADAGFTLCEALLARNGSILMSSGLKSGRSLLILPPVHMVLAYQNQLFMDLKEGFLFLRKKYVEQFPSSVVCMTGPSRTADIEKTLVLGAHGPKKLIVFFIDK